MTNSGAKAKQTKKKRPPMPWGVRMILKTIGVLVFPVLCLIGLYVGLQIGYVRFGGGDPAEVLQWETWKHMLDLVFAES